MITVTMGNNVFVSGVLTALIEIPSYLFCLAFMDKIGRKPICVLTFMATGFTCIPAAFASGYLQVALALIGKLQKCLLKEWLHESTFFCRKVW